jgi:thiamine biosynthesis lipoprotein
MFGTSNHERELGSINRRSFLKISGALGLGVAAYPIGISLAESVKFDKKLYKVSKSRLGMGTLVSITVLNPSKDQAQEAIELAFKEIERLTKLMSRHSPDTPVAHLNRDGFLKGVPPELFFVMKESIRYHRISKGFFDITVKPILDIYVQYCQSSKEASIPTEKIQDLLDLVDANLVSFSKDTIGFKKDGMGITLDGIAKGFIVDKAAEKLIKRGITHALVNAGGDIRTIGDKGSNRPWTIAIEDPLKKKNYPDIVTITNTSIATSGNYEIFFDREKVIHHIINPKTGLSPLTNSSVSVQAPTAVEADALSTTLLILEPAQGTRLIQALPQCESLIVTRNNVKIKSAGWQGIKI